MTIQDTSPSVDGETMTDRERAIQAIRRGVPLGQVIACSCHRSQPVRNGCFGVCEDAVDAIIASYEDLRRALAPPSSKAREVIGNDGKIRPITLREIIAEAALMVIQKPDGVETLDWQIADAVIAALRAIPASDARVREALAETRDALSALKKAVEASQKMNGREYIDLGIQVNNALDRALAALTAKDKP